MTGLLSVRSVCWIALEEVPKGGTISASNDSNLRKFWKYLWSMNIPRNVRHFAWKACKDILPMKENLKRRKVFVDSCCEVCQMKAKSSGHLFWNYFSAKEVWRLSKLFSRQMTLQFSSFMDLIWYVAMVVKWENDYVEKIIMIAWATWSNWNKVINGEDKKSNGALVDSAVEYLMEYQVYCEKPTVAQTKEQPKWRPPQHGRYKINIDGAMFAAQKAAGLGVLIRDTEGRVVGVCNKKIMAPLGAVEIEAKAF